MSRLTVAGVLAAGLTVAASGCGVISGSTPTGASQGGGFKLASYIQDHINKKQTLTIKVSYHDPSLAFAKPIKDGVEKAGKELGVNVDLIGPSGGDAAKQVNELQTLITQKSVDGIAVSSASSDALKPVIAQAYNAGIPIISFNTDNPASKQMAFVGQDLKASGKSQAEQLVKDLGATKAGKIVVFSLDTGAGWSHDRFAGFQEGVKGTGYNIVGPVNVGNEPSAAYNIVESTMTGQSGVVAISGLDCCSTTAAGKWVQQSRNAGKIVVGGFDLLPTTAQFIQSHVVNFTISQNPSEQGFQAVKILYDFLAKGKTPKSVDTGAQFVTVDNLSTAPVEG